MMAGLQRSAVSFRRQGSSGLIWDDKLFSGELNQIHKPEEEEGGGEGRDDRKQIKAAPRSREIKPEAPPPPTTSAAGSVRDGLDRSRSNGGGRGLRPVRVSPAIDPPSPKLSGCGFCSPFAKPEKARKSKAGKHRPR